LGMSARRTAIGVEGVGGFGVSLVGAAMAGLGVPKPAWAAVLVVGLALIAWAAFQWFRGRGQGDRAVPWTGIRQTGGEGTHYRPTFKGRGPGIDHLGGKLTTHTLEAEERVDDPSEADDTSA
jgi:hypothetical protein